MYTVFQTHADATAAWNEWVTAGEDGAWFGTRAAWDCPSELPVSWRQQRHQEQPGNVTGTVFTVTTNAVSGSAPSHSQAATVALARAANAHLLAIN